MRGSAASLGHSGGFLDTLEIQRRPAEGSATFESTLKVSAALLGLVGGPPEAALGGAVWRPFPRSFGRPAGGNAERRRPSVDPRR